MRKQADDLRGFQRPILIMAFLLCGSLFTGIAGLHAEETGAACTPVATIFDQAICRETLEKKARGTLETGVVEGLPEQAMDMDKAEEEVSVSVLQDVLRREIWLAALREKFGATVFDVDPEMMEAYRAKADSLKKEGYERNKKVRSLLTTALTDENRYSAEERRVMQGILKATESSILVYEKKREHVESAPKSMGFIDEESANEFSRRAIRRWQIDKTLFKTYGGKLVQAGNMIVPVDAYRHFGLYILKEGLPEITEDDLSPVKAAFANSPGIPESQALEGDDPQVTAYFADPLLQLKEDSTLPDVDLLKSWLEERAQDE